MKESYEKKRIGRLIGFGGEHLIFAYDNEQVIKFSWHVFFSGRFGVKKLQEDYAIGRKYFKQYLLPTEIRVWNNGCKAVEIQEKVDCRSFKREDLQDERLRSQLRDIFTMHEVMQKETGMTFDMFGFKGLLGFLAHQEINNIKVLSNGKLTILDFTVLALRPQWYEYLLLFFIRWARRRQAHIIERYWKDL